MQFVAMICYPPTARNGETPKENIIFKPTFCIGCWFRVGDMDRGRRRARSRRSKHGPHLGCLSG